MKLFVLNLLALLMLQTHVLSLVNDRIVLQNDQIYISFDSNSYEIEYLSKSESSESRIQNTNEPSPFWTSKFLTPEGTKIIDGSSACYEKSYIQNKDQLILIWEQFEDVEVSISATVTLNKNLIEFVLSFESSSEDVALWEWAFQTGEKISITENDKAIDNEGFGILKPAKTNFTELYPSSAYQFMALYNEKTQVNGIYFATHDPKALTKNFNYLTKNSLVSLSSASQPPNAGIGGYATYQTEYPVVLTVFDGDWWDAAQIYKNWVIPNGEWMSKGTLKQREDVPEWLLNLTVWVNSHWQRKDIFDKISGDPQVVYNRVTSIQDRFQLSSMGLHYYEWDLLGYELGSNYTNCTSEVSCGFDTHYPEYLPARLGFTESVKKMKESGIRVAPYINGRLFDKGTETWDKENGELTCAKCSHEVLNDTNLYLYEEQYGSKAEFAVACPHSEYWQQKLTNISKTIFDDYNVDGIYYDQVAAKEPKSCWDESHNHSLGGGNYHITGFKKLLSQIGSLTGNDKVLLTESNQEAYLGEFNMFLTLRAYRAPIFGSTRGIPMFCAIYGGYFLTVGAEFFVYDLAPNPNVFTAKIARQYIFGSQIGWFSLGGKCDSLNPSAGLYDILMEERYDSEVEFLKLLSDYKTIAKEWFNHGYAMRDLKLKVDRKYESDQVLSSTWMNDQQEMIINIVSFEKDVNLDISFEIQMKQFKLKENENYRIVQVNRDGTESYITTVKNNFKFEKQLMGREVVLLKFQNISETPKKIICRTIDPRATDDWCKSVCVDSENNLHPACDPASGRDQVCQCDELNFAIN